MYAYIMLTNNCFWAYTISTWPIFVSDLLGSYNQKLADHLQYIKAHYCIIQQDILNQISKVNK